MWKHLLNRLLTSGLVLFIVLSLTFVLVQAAPGGLSILMDPNMSTAEYERLSRNFGLDRPPHVQYLSWLGSLLRGDLGASLTYGFRPVSELVLTRIPMTALLGAAAALMTLVLGVPLGIVAARNQNRFGDHVISLLTSIGLATPNFWLGIMLIVVFSVSLGWLPASGVRTIGSGGDLADRLAHLIMPTVVMASGTVAELVRYTRSAWLETLALDYVLVARGKGAAERRIDYHHVMKNALIPILTVFGIALPRLIGGSAIVETLFGWPGIGQLAVDAAMRRDTPLILGVTTVVAVSVILSNLLIDLTYPLLDPRIVYS